MVIHPSDEDVVPSDPLPLGPPSELRQRCRGGEPDRRVRVEAARARTDLRTITAHEVGGDEEANAEPYLWTVFFKVRRRHRIRRKSLDRPMRTIGQPAGGRAPGPVANRPRVGKVTDKAAWFSGKSCAPMRYWVAFSVSFRLMFTTRPDCLSS